MSPFHAQIAPASLPRDSDLGPAALTSESMGASETPAAAVLPEPVTEDDTAVWSLRHLQFLRSWTTRPKPEPYPPISSIPPTASDRLLEPDASPTPFPSEPVLAQTFHSDADADAEAPATQPGTVLYLAYGSNMCAETFLGMRGIRPLSQVNVSAPSLDLTFDLPGRPYSEPCFANTAFRKIPGTPPKLPPDLPTPPIKPPLTSDDADEDEHDNGETDGSNPLARRRDPVWNKGLYGVVYEVTHADYAKIFRTEGGGAGYHEILVPCFVLPPSIRIPEPPSPGIPIPPRPFLARTLYAPRLPDPTSPPSPTKTTTSPFSLPHWLTRLRSLPHRPSPSVAQPSLRYLTLLRTGAREHDLPPAYQSYLSALQPYTITTTRQKVGAFAFTLLWIPLLAPPFLLMQLLADDRGRAPGWIVGMVSVAFNLVWMGYDVVGKRVFGDGERTMEGGVKSGRVREAGVGEKRRRSSFASGLRGKEEAVDEEKRALLGGY